jgi:uncharacterized protein (DUF608 family)
MSSNPKSEPCVDAPSGLPRRDFLKLGSVAAGGAALMRTGLMPVMAGPFEENEYLKTIPADKKLDPDWVRSLSARGEKQTYSDPAALDHIGMPVGGFFAGTVYLAGDGRLWLWDIFNRDQEAILPRDQKAPGGISGGFIRGGLNYLYPAPITQPFQQGFSLRLGNQDRPLDRTGFRQVTFDGRYPIGRVNYQDDACPLEVRLEAFSPFIPGDLDASSLPATVMSFRLTNQSNRTVEAELLGELENAVCLDSRKQATGRLRNRVVRKNGFIALACSAEGIEQTAGRPEILFQNFEGTDYGDWTAEGDAFGAGPIQRDRIPDYQGDVGGQGQRVVNSHATAPGSDVGSKDSRTGKLISPEFTITRRFINLWVGGGAHQERTCVNVLINGDVVTSVTGRSNNRMSPQSLNVSDHEGKTARLEIVDAESGAWGNIGVDHIVFSDQPASAGPLEEERDFGTMTLSLLGDSADVASANVSREDSPAQTVGTFDKPLVGRLARRVRLEPGQSVTVDFAITWHFPNFRSRGCGNALVGHHYAARFDSALDVTRHLQGNLEHLAGTTRRWVETWYDSTLPYWFLDRTMANTSTLATTTCYRFKDGRFWAWEGIGCCHGTCTHVWHYAQAPGRLFPELERLQRERVDFGLALHEDGQVGHRANLTGSSHAADDGQCGRILGVLREHQMSADDAFLRRLWSKVKPAIEYLIRKDGNADGMIEGGQPNTLDASWYGKISFLASLYLATLRAGEIMARELGETDFANECARIADRGARSILELYNGEYFIQIEDPAHAKEVGIGPGCYIDQVFGQTWAHWVGVGNLFDRDKQLSALRALWRFNFVPDIGAFRKTFERGRWYATAGDAGLIMCSWPKGGQNPAFKNHWQYMYFNECMTGFEWQAASHMIWEGHDQPDILQNGLAVARAIHDRYDARLRNPYNEIECSDHYARAMASYGAYQAACGFQCHGPQGHVEFAPRLAPENFRAAFVTAEGWGSFEQQRRGAALRARIDLNHGTLNLRTLVLAVPGKTGTPAVRVEHDGQTMPARVAVEAGRATIAFSEPLSLQDGQSLQMTLT